MTARSSPTSPALLEAKLRALARACSGIELTQIDADLGVGVGRAGDGAGAVGFHLVEDDPRAVGRALRWADARSLSRVELLVENGAGHLARRAGLLSATGADGGPGIGVWTVDGAAVEPAEPEPVIEPPILPADHWALAGVLSEAGARPIDDHGVLVGEVAGLEVARVVDGPDGPAIDVGVGQADRELAALVHGSDEVSDGLRRVIGSVAEHRRPGSHHPLARVARERWLRSLVLDAPPLIGASTLEPVVPLRGRGGLSQPEPSAAAGRLRSGSPVVVVAVAGVDLDVVPEAADYRHRHDPEAEVILIMPSRDLELGTALLDRLPSARALALEEPWAIGTGPSPNI